MILRTLWCIEDAQNIYLNVLQTQISTLGEHHADVLYTQSQLVDVYVNRRMYTEAEDLQETLLQIQTDKLGTLHLETIESLRRLSQIYLHQSQHQKAIKLALRLEDAEEQYLKNNTWGSEYA